MPPMTLSVRMICSFCGTELPTDLDVFGPVESPLCRKCFLAGAEVEKQLLKDARTEYDELVSRLEHIEQELKWLEREQMEIENRLVDLKKRPGVVPAAVNEKLDQWISGQAMKYLVP